MFFDRDWLLATLREARDRSNAVSAADRPAMLQKLPARQWLDFTPLGARPEFRHAPHGNAFAELRAEIGRAHVCTPVTNAHLVCRLMLEKKKLKQASERT